MITKEEKAEREAKARELFAQGLSVAQVAKQLFKNYWAAAKAVKDAMDGVAPGLGKKAGKKKARKPRAAEAEAEPEFWDLTLQLPAAEMDRMFAALSEDEKAVAMQSVMQARLDALIAA